MTQIAIGSLSRQFTPWRTKLPWLDRAGRLSMLKLVVFTATVAPALWIVYQGIFEDLGPRPVNEVIHQTGTWAVRFLLASLAVTPLRRILDQPRLIIVRRMLGVTALAYTIFHLALYCLDQKFDLWKITSEIVLRVYLTIGFAAFLGLLALGLTSTDRAIARLGAHRWQMLHSAVYVLTGLGLIHYFLQSKQDLTQATLITGFAILLLGHRVMLRLGIKNTPATLLGLACAAAVATAGLEAGWYFFKSGIPLLRILLANLDVSGSIRPALWVLVAGFALAGLNLVFGRVGEKMRGRSGRARTA